MAEVALSRRLSGRFARTITDEATPAGSRGRQDEGLVAGTIPSKKRKASVLDASHLGGGLLEDTEERRAKRFHSSAGRVFSAVGINRKPIGKRPKFQAWRKLQSSPLRGRGFSSSSARESAVRDLTCSEIEALTSRRAEAQKPTHPSALSLPLLPTPRTEAKLIASESDSIIGAALQEASKQKESSKGPISKPSAVNQIAAASQPPPAKSASAPAPSPTPPAPAAPVFQFASSVSVPLSMPAAPTAVGGTPPVFQFGGSTPSQPHAAPPSFATGVSFATPAGAFSVGRVGSQRKKGRRKR